MVRLELVYRLALADFRERTRRYSFLFTLLGTVFFGFLVITGKWTIHLGDYRGEYNSAWVGSLMASASTMMLAIFGFYLVKNSITRDRHTRVGEILAATPLGRWWYVAAKSASNFAVLAFMTVVLAVTAVAMQLVVGVTDDFSLWALVAPFLFLCLPVMTLVAAMAVLFESVRWLRGTIGNVLYLFIAEFAFLNSILINAPLLDFGGFGMILPSMEAAALAAYPDAHLGFEIGFLGFIEDTAAKPMKLFVWDGLEWSLELLPLRLLWLGWAIGISSLAAVCFDRFDPARAGRVKTRRKKKKKKSPELEEIAGAPVSARSWRDLTAVKPRFNGARMLGAELRLMLKGLHWSWYIIAAGLIAVQAAVPLEYARAYALPAAWIWPLAIWSAMGTREARFNTSDLMLSSAYPVSRQFPAVWMAGIIVALLTASGMIVRALIAADMPHVTSLLAGAFFVPTLALTLGTLSGSKKLFEVVYLLIWYIGPVNGLVPLDFAGATDAGVTQGNAMVYLLASLALGSVALLWRRNQVAAGWS
jgi:hypothetical protein